MLRVCYPLEYTILDYYSTPKEHKVVENKRQYNDVENECKRV